MDHNSEWKEEQKHVDEVTDVIKEKQKEIAKSTGSLKEDVIDLRKNFWEDVTVNLEEVDDVIETQASIKQQAELLSERERSHGQLYKNAKLLERMQSSPYFGRFDFSENGEESDIFYIGISSLMDQEGEDFLVYDWRAPVSSLYYDYAPGAASYDTPGGIVEGEMTKKKQYIIENGTIQGMFDTGITIGDSLLKRVLGGQATAQMKSIVATIQREQNAIIRHEGSRLLIVQGVAGSGKTSAAMQRIAYLMYRYRKQITADQILLFSPNQMFSSYVSSVLPELGEENMQQSTFQEYVQKRLDEEYTLESPFEQLESTLVDRRNKEASFKEGVIQFKSSLAYKDLMDQYLESLSTQGLPFRNIKFLGETRLSAGEVADYFYKLDQEMSIPNRIDLVKEWILAKLKEVEKEERAKDWPEEEAALLDKEDYMKAYHKLEANQNFDEETFDDFERELEFLKKAIVKRRLAPLRKQVNEYKFIHMRKLYAQLFEYDFESSLVPAHWSEICKYTRENVINKYLPVEDQTPYLYLQDRIEGRKINASIRYVLLDEAQDYSIFQYHYIKEMFPYAQFTLLGDRHQAIYLHNQGQTTILSKEAHEGEATKMELLRSYRSTRPIVEFSKHILKDSGDIQAFNREGSLPRLHEADSDYMDQVVAAAKDHLAEGHETVAILCHTKSESIHVYNRVKEELEATLIYKETQPFQKGILVLPVYLAKGIEFDGVIVFDASHEVYRTEHDRLMLYTACTRAMHELDLFYKHSSPFLNDIPGHLYQKQTAVQS